MIALQLHMDPGLTPEELEQAIQRGHESAVVEIAEWLKQRVLECIANGVDPWGDPWEPLDPDTRSPTGRAGFRTGAMYGSVTATPTQATQGVVTATVTVGATYAAFFSARRQLVPLVWDRKVNARGRRLKSRALRHEMPEAWTQHCLEVDARHTLAAIEEAGRVALARQQEFLQRAADLSASAAPAPSFSAEMYADPWG